MLSPCQALGLLNQSSDQEDPPPSYTCKFPFKYHQFQSYPESCHRVCNTCSKVSSKILGGKALHYCPSEGHWFIFSSLQVGLIVGTIQSPHLTTVGVYLVVWSGHGVHFPQISLKCMRRDIIIWLPIPHFSQILPT